MKLASNDNAHALPRLITDNSSGAILSNNNKDDGDNAEILSNAHRRENVRTSSDDNNELNDEMPVSKSTSLNCHTHEGNTNYILSNQQINTVTSKRPTRTCSEVDNRESWYTAIGEKEPHEEFPRNNHSADCCTGNNNQNNRKETTHHTTWNQLDALEENIQHETKYSTLNKESFEPEISSERHTEYNTCPVRFNANDMNPKDEEPTVVSEDTQRETDTVSCCMESSSLGTVTELQMGKGESWLARKDSEQSASQPESTATESTETFQVTPESSASLPSYLKTLVEGKSVCGDTYAPFTKPDWLDVEKFQRGQRFANNHIFGVMFAELISLMILFAIRSGLEPLIFTGKSDTPYKAFKRYLSTVRRVKSWYEGDIWDTDSAAHKNLKAVRALHDVVRNKIEAAPQEDVAKRVTLEGKDDTQPMWTDLHGEILEDFNSSACPLSGSPKSSRKEVYINQFDMALAQFGFLGLIMVFPKMFGVHYATDEDFEGFAHFWRTIGYLLGTEDRFNLCHGDLKTVRQRCLDIVTHWVKPMLREVSRDWVHMSRCVFKGVSYYVPCVQFEVMLMYLCRVLDIKAVKLAASLTFLQYCLYLETVFLYWFTFRLPGMWRLHNWLINLAVKRALHMGPKHLTKLEHRVYPYETPVNTSTRL